MKKVLFILLLVVASSSMKAQSWRHVRQEVFFGVGASNFMGDLGGAKGIGSHGIKDLKIRPTRPALTAGYKYMLMPELSVRGHLVWGYLNGDDAHTKNVIRNTRNLSFRSMIGEISATAEFYPWGERVKPKYKVRGIVGHKAFSVMPYVYMGIGCTFFNPKAKYNGTWYALQPLGTEGQGLAGRPEKYKRVTMVFPIGLGFKYPIDEHWSVSYDMSLRYTTTDYMDDVSTSYYHLDEIEAANGPMAAILSDRTNDPSAGITGAIPLGAGRTNYLQRGDPYWNDAYMFAIFSVHYRFAKGGTFIPKF